MGCVALAYCCSLPTVRCVANAILPPWCCLAKKCSSAVQLGTTRHQLIDKNKRDTLLYWNSRIALVKLHQGLVVLQSLVSFILIGVKLPNQHNIQCKVIQNHTYPQVEEYKNKCSNTVQQITTASFNLPKEQGVVV